MQEDLSERSLRLVSELYQINTRMGHLNRNLLLLAKIENSQYDQLESIELYEFIKKLLPSYNQLIINGSVELNQDDNPDAVINANPILLECMINNLVVNAIRHTKTGNIRILLKNSTDLEISNPSDGRPLNANEIFRRFHSGDSDNTGTGLGLAIVKAICDFHEWKIIYLFSEKQHIFRISWVNRN